MKKIIGIIVAVIIIAAGAYYFYQQKENEKQQENTEKEVIKIGAILPLTGPGAVFAEYIKKGINLAINTVNNDTMFNSKFVVIFEDSQTKPKEGVNSYKKLVNDKVDVIIVALSSVAEAIKGYSNTDSIPQIGIAVATTEYTKGFDYIFRVYPNANTMAGEMANYNSKILKMKKSCIIYIDDDFGRSSKNAYINIFESNGGKVVLSESYKIIQKDFKDIIAKITNIKPDCIYLNGYGQAYPSFIKQLYSTAKFDFTLTADMTMGLPTTINSINEIKDTIYYVDANINSNFIEEYKNKYGKEPTSYAGYAFDIISLLKEALKNKLESNVKKNIKQNLLKIQDYNGTMGKITIDSTGDCNLKFEIKKVINGKTN